MSKLIDKINSRYGTEFISDKDIPRDFKFTEDFVEENLDDINIHYITTHMDLSFRFIINNIDKIKDAGEILLYQHGTSVKYYFIFLLFNRVLNKYIPANSTDDELEKYVLG